MSTAPMDEAYYYGCWQEVGHFLWLPRMRRAAYSVDQEFTKLFGRHIDGGFQPRTYREGAALLHHVEGWTILSSVDNSVDKRGNSHSTFILRGTWDFDEALRRATEQFPEVMARIKPPTVVTDEAVLARSRRLGAK